MMCQEDLFSFFWRIFVQLVQEDIFITLRFFRRTVLVCYDLKKIFYYVVMPTEPNEKIIVFKYIFNNVYRPSRSNCNMCLQMTGYLMYCQTWTDSKIQKILYDYRTSATQRPNLMISF